MCPSAPILPCLRSMCLFFQIHPACNEKSRNVPGKTFGPNWCNLDRSVTEIGWYSTIAPNGIIGPVNGIAKRLPYGVFPSDKRSWIFRRLQWQSMESAHQFSFRPDCNNTAEVPSLTPRTALSPIPFVSDLCGVDVQWFQDNSLQDSPNSKELSV